MTVEVKREIDKLQERLEDLAEQLEARVRFAKLVKTVLARLRREAPANYAKALAWHRRRSAGRPTKPPPTGGLRGQPMTVDAIAEIRAVRHEEGHVRVAPGELDRAVAVTVRKALGLVGVLVVAAAAAVVWALWRTEPERRAPAAGPEAGPLEAAAPEAAKEAPAAPNPEKGGKDQETAKRKQREEAEADERARQAAAERRAAAAAERAAAAEKKRREALEEWMAAEAEKKRNDDAEKKRRAAEAKKAAKDEEFASERLKYARKPIDEGMDDLAKERLRKIIKEQPDTKAAAEARKLLESIKP